MLCCYILGRHAKDCCFWHLTSYYLQSLLWLVSMPVRISAAKTFNLGFCVPKPLDNNLQRDTLSICLGWWFQVIYLSNNKIGYQFNCIFFSFTFENGKTIFVELRGISVQMATAIPCVQEFEQFWHISHQFDLTLSPSPCWQHKISLRETCGDF